MLEVAADLKEGEAQGATQQRSFWTAKTRRSVEGRRCGGGEMGAGSLEKGQSLNGGKVLVVDPVKCESKRGGECKNTKEKGLGKRTLNYLKDWIDNT